jgi:hypothetical protein
MGFFKKEEEQTARRDVPKRVQNLDRASLLQWFDTTIMGLGASFDRWRYHGGPEGEVTETLKALEDIWEELQRRVDATK